MKSKLKLELQRGFGFRASGGDGTPVSLGEIWAKLILELNVRQKLAPGIESQRETKLAARDAAQLLLDRIIGVAIIELQLSAGSSELAWRPYHLFMASIV